MFRNVKALLVVAAIMIVPAMLFAGGAESGGTQSSASISSMTIYLDRILVAEDGIDQWIAEYTEQTGIQLEIVKPPHNQYSEVLGATVMAGDIPDLMELFTDAYPTYVNSGHLVPLEDFIAANPNTAAINPAQWEAYRASDGHVYGFPTYKGGGCVTYVRQDWLDNLGLAAPTTWNEFVNVLRAFTFNDPDGNGQDDTVGLAIPFSVAAAEFDYYIRNIMQDAYFGFVYDDAAGEWVDGFSQPAFRAALQRWVQLYSEGIIDREFFTSNTSNARSKLTEGRAGMMEYWTGTWATRLDTSAQSINPNARINSIAPIQGAHFFNRVGPMLCISRYTANPQAVFDNIIGHMWDGDAGQILWTYGVEGLHWERNAAGQAVKMPQPSNPSTPFNKAFIDPYLSMNNMTPLIAQDPREARSIELHNQYSRSLRLVMGGDVYTRNIGELNTVKQELFSKMVTGELTIDAGLAEYARRAESLDIDTILAELNG